VTRRCASPRFRADVVRRGVGPLLRADDGGGGLPQVAITPSSSASWPRRWYDWRAWSSASPALRRHVGGAGDAVLPGRSVS
jgi:hypothetical protein